MEERIPGLLCVGEWAAVNQIQFVYQQLLMALGDGRGIKALNEEEPGDDSSLFI